MYKVEDVQFELLGRFIELEDRGFKLCIFVDTENEHHEVYSMGSPSQGLRYNEVLSMPEDEYQDLLKKYTN